MNKVFFYRYELTLSQSAGLGDLSVVEQADAAPQRSERYHTPVVFNLTAGTALQDYKENPEIYSHILIQKNIPMPATYREKNKKFNVTAHFRVYRSSSDTSYHLCLPLIR